MLEKSRLAEFPLKEFITNGRKKGYTSYLHFTTFITDVIDSTDKIQFKCIFCPQSISATIGATSNVLKHIKKHRQKSTDLDNWLKAFELSSKKPDNKVILDSKLLNLIRFYAHSNEASSLFDSVYFRKILNFSAYFRILSKNIATTIANKIDTVTIKNINPICLFKSL